MRHAAETLTLAGLILTAFLVGVAFAPRVRPAVSYRLSAVAGVLVGVSIALEIARFA